MLTGILTTLFVVLVSLISELLMAILRVKSASLPIKSSLRGIVRVMLNGCSFVCVCVCVCKCVVRAYG